MGHLDYRLEFSWEVAERVREPAAPRRLEVDAVEYNRVELDWRRPYHDGNCDIENYIIEDKPQWPLAGIGGGYGGRRYGL